MATEEYLFRFLEQGKRYEDLPPRFRQTLTEDDWRRKWVGWPATGSGPLN